MFDVGTCTRVMIRKTTLNFYLSIYLQLLLLQIPVWGSINVHLILSMNLKLLNDQVYKNIK